MVMADLIAILRMGELEQVASPREIYSRPATAYTAQFIGHTNLLRGEVKGGIVRCHSLSWPADLPDGPVLFSLRPENIRFAAGASGSNAVHFIARLRTRIFHGAAERLLAESAASLVVS